MYHVPEEGEGETGQWLRRAHKRKPAAYSSPDFLCGEREVTTRSKKAVGMRRGREGAAG